MMKKKCLPLFLALSLLLSITVPAFASEPSLEQIASNTIAITHTTQENGLEVTTYENLDVFIDAVQGQFPVISDREIAEFLVEFSGQNSALLPEAAVMKILDYDNISIASSYVKVNEDGSSEEISKQEAQINLLGAEYTDPNGIMKFETGFSKLYTSGSTKHFNVWSSATWIKYPAICIEDAFVLGTNGSYNDMDVVDDFGYVHQAFRCSTCGKATPYYRDVHVNAPEDEDLIMEYTSQGVPALKFAPRAPYCQYGHSGHDAKDSLFTVYINYDVLVEGSGMIQAGYGHATLGLAGISVSVSPNGSPSFSGGISTVVNSIYARPVSLV